MSSPGNDITHWFELSVAPWFSTDVCDPQSTPMLPCTPESDSNAPSATSPGAGAGFVELQFYALGFAPFGDNISCDNTHWCSRSTSRRSIRARPPTTSFRTVPGRTCSTRRENATLEPDDSPCYPAGDTHGGTVPPNQVSGCDVFFDAIGDLDYDGTSYRADRPTSVNPGRFPAAFAQAQPTSSGATYPQIQFETDLAATENGCDLSTGAGCTVPPPGPGHFYPFWTLARDSQLGCTWQFGNVQSGQTFGGDAQYGQVTFTPPARSPATSSATPAVNGDSRSAQS